MAISRGILLALFGLLPAMLQVESLGAESFQAEHRISFPNRQSQYLEVQLRFPVQTEELELIMPVWTPGSYLIRDYAAHVEQLRATGESHGSLDVEKSAKNRWRVKTAGETEITVNYSVWAGELSVNTNWVESGFALLNGAGIFLYTESSRNWPQSVTVDLPEDWASVKTSLPQVNGQWRFLASDYDELVDSPMLLGNAPDYRFSLAGQDYVLVNQGESRLWDGARSAQDVASVVNSVQTFWGVNPLAHPYFFLNVIAQGCAGLEHDHSTVLLANSWQMRYREEYINWLALVTHEFFHAWNVRRMRPEAFKEYDYERETYSRELWLAEGLTSYYDNLLLLRSGLITVAEYFALLANEIHQYETTPGRNVESAELASFNAWIKHYKPDANSVNSGVSYYRQGALIGLVLDQSIRKATEGKASLDAVMREMYRLYGPQGSSGSSYPPDAIENLIEQVAGKPTRNLLEQLLTTTTSPEVDGTLAWYGLYLDRVPSRAAVVSLGKSPPAGFGLTWSDESEDLIVESVLRDSSGAAAGILPADELLAIDGTRVTKKNIDDRMLRLQPGETTELLVVRHGNLVTLTAVTQEATPDHYEILVMPGIDRHQKEHIGAWLGVPLKFVNN